MSRDSQQALAMALEQRVPPATAEIAGLLALTRDLEALPDPRIDLDFALRLEALLLSDGVPATIGAPVLRAVPDLAPVPAPAPDPEIEEPAAPVIPLGSRRRVFRRSAVAAVAAAAMFAFPLAASAGSLPGSPFYGLRTGVLERAEMALSGDAIGKAFKHLEFSGRRAQDAVQLVARGAGADLVAATLRAQEREARAGVTGLLGATGDHTVLARALSIVRSGAQTLSGLVGRVAVGAESHLSTALSSNRAMAERLAGLLGLGAAAPKISIEVPAGAGRHTVAPPSAPRARVDVRPDAADSSPSSSGSGGTAPDAPEAPDAPPAPEAPGGSEPDLPDAPRSQPGTGGGCAQPGQANGLSAPVLRDLLCPNR